MSQPSLSELPLAKMLEDDFEKHVYTAFEPLNPASESIAPNRSVEVQAPANCRHYLIRMLRSFASQYQVGEEAFSR